MEFYSINSPDKLWRAEISARLGANITKLQYKGEDILVPLISEEQLEENPYIHGCPILLPANRTYKGRFCFEGKEYSLPLNDPKNDAHLHGFVHRAVFDAVEIGTNKIVLEYVNKGDCYPFDFRLQVKYVIDNDGFYQYYTVENIGSCNMPFTFALHASFIEPDLFSVPICLCQQKNKHHIPTGQYVPLNSQEKKYVSGSISKGLIISGYYKSCGNTAKIGKYRYTVSDNFDHWILFNAYGEGNLICIEPQCGAVNGLNIDDGFNVLKPGAKEIFSTIIKTV